MTNTLIAMVARWAKELTALNAPVSIGITLTYTPDAPAETTPGVVSDTMFGDLPVGR